MRLVETVTLDVKVCAAVQVLVVVKSVEAGEATHWGVVPGPWLDRRYPLVPAELLATKAPDTTKFEEIVTAWLAAPKLAALFTVIEEL